MRFSGNVIFAGALFCVNSDAFIPRSKHQRPSFSQTTQGNPTLSPFQPSGQVDDVSLVALFAKKKKGANAKSAALDALDLLDDELDAPLSKKEQKALEKKKKKEEAAAKAAAEREASQPPQAFSWIPEAGLPCISRIELLFVCSRPHSRWRPFDAQTMGTCSQWWTS